MTTYLLKVMFTFCLLVSCYSCKKELKKSAVIAPEGMVWVETKTFLRGLDPIYRLIR